MSSSKETNSKTRSINGNPRPYFDSSSNRWRAVGYYIDQDGNRKCVRGSGKTKQLSVSKRDDLIKKQLETERNSSMDESLKTVSKWIEYYMNVHCQFPKQYFPWE